MSPRNIRMRETTKPVPRNLETFTNRISWRELNMTPMVRNYRHRGGYQLPGALVDQVGEEDLWGLVRYRAGSSISKTLY